MATEDKFVENAMSLFNFLPSRSSVMLTYRGEEEVKTNTIENKKKLFQNFFILEKYDHIFHPTICRRAHPFSTSLISC